MALQAVGNPSLVFAELGAREGIVECHSVRIASGEVNILRGRKNAYALRPSVVAVNGNKRYPMPSADLLPAYFDSSGTRLKLRAAPCKKR